MAQNWPPAAGTFPSIYPLDVTTFQVSSLQALWLVLKPYGFTVEEPTQDEAALFFKQVRCDHGHPCQGKMLVSPDGTQRWPVAYCTGAGHMAGMLPWENKPGSGQHELGAYSGTIA